MVGFCESFEGIRPVDVGLPVSAGVSDGPSSAAGSSELEPPSFVGVGVCPFFLGAEFGGGVEGGASVITGWTGWYPATLCVWSVRSAITAGLLDFADGGQLGNSGYQAGIWSFMTFDCPRSVSSQISVKPKHFQKLGPNIPMFPRLKNEFSFPQYMNSLS